MNSINRYAEVAERELRDGSRRDPVWDEVLTEAGGDEEIARELYQHRRVSQNIEMEEQRHAATEALHKQQKFNDSLGLTLGQKIILTGIGFSAIVGVGLWYIAKYHR